MKIYTDYTDLEQSKKLAEFLPLESADAFYVIGKGPVDIVVIYGFVTHKHLKEQIAYKRAVPCWSLAALFSMLPKIGAEEPMLRKLYYANEPKERYVCEYGLTNITSEYDNPVDACVAMIEKLHKLELL